MCSRWCSSLFSHAAPSLKQRHLAPCRMPQQLQASAAARSGLSPTLSQPPPSSAHIHGRPLRPHVIQLRPLHGRERQPLGLCHRLPRRALQLPGVGHLPGWDRRQRFSRGGSRATASATLAQRCTYELARMQGCASRASRYVALTTLSHRKMRPNASSGRMLCLQARQPSQAQARSQPG